MTEAAACKSLQQLASRREHQVKPGSLCTTPARTPPLVPRTCSLECLCTVAHLLPAFLSGIELVSGIATEGAEHAAADVRRRASRLQPPSGTSQRSQASCALSADMRALDE